jgi:hypothetical protein
LNVGLQNPWIVAWKRLAEGAAIAEGGDGSIGNSRSEDLAEAPQMDADRTHANRRSTLIAPLVFGQPYLPPRTGLMSVFALRRKEFTRVNT